MHQPTTPHPKRQAAAYRTLYDRGARFVLCRADKRPLWRRWQKRRPDLATVQLHVKGGDPVGLVPFSIKSTGLDVDRGDPSQLFSLYPPVVAIPSKRRGGLHGYYGDGQGRANGRFELHGCAGEIRGSRGYLVLHGNAALELAGADFDVAEGLPGWFPATFGKRRAWPLTCQDSRALLAKRRGRDRVGKQRGGRAGGAGPYPARRSQYFAIQCRAILRIQPTATGRIDALAGAYLRLHAKRQCAILGTTPDHRGATNRVVYRVLVLERRRPA